MSEQRAAAGKIRAYGLVRDANGNPKIDVPLAQLPRAVIDLLTDADLAYLAEKEK